MFNAKKSDDNAAYSNTANTNNRAFTAEVDANAQNCSIINEWLTMRGDLESEGDILIKGKVHGNITCKLLIVDAEAMIEGGITCEDLVVRGTTRGIIRARRVRVEKTANLDGEIYQESFAAEEGARIRGALHYGTGASEKPEDTKPASVVFQMLDAAARNGQHAHN